MRILLLCQYFPPEMGAPSARTYEHARHWASLGHEVTVVTGFPNHPTGVIHPEYRGYFSKRERIDGMDVLRTWVYVTANRGFTKRILNFLSFFSSSFILGVLKTGRPDVVIGTSPQFFCAVSAFLLSRIKRVPFVFEVRDIWPQSAVELGALSNTILIRALRAIELFLYRRAALIVAVAESTRPYLLEKGIPTEKIAVIPNGIDAKFLMAAAAPREVRAELGLEGKFIVSYIGTHGISHALETVLSAAQMLGSDGDGDVHFLFVGEGAEKEKLERLAGKLQLRNVTFLSQQPRETLLAFYRASDVSLVPLRKLPIFRKVLPSKLFELMGASCAIICSVEGEAASLVDRAQAGLCIQPESANQLVDAIRRLRSTPDLVARFGANGRRFVTTHHMRSTLAERYLEALSKVVGGPQLAEHPVPLITDH